MKLKTKFQDEDFELGEVVDANIFYPGNGREGFKVVAAAKAGGLYSFYYNSIKDFTDHWEDAPEEPKEFWYVDLDGNVGKASYSSYVSKGMKQIGNYFDTEEEAEKAVEKLKAWKRLKDARFKFTDWYRDVCEVSIQAEIHDDGTMGMINDLDLLFGGEE